MDEDAGSELIEGSIKAPSSDGLSQTMADNEKLVRQVEESVGDKASNRPGETIKDEDGNTVDNATNPEMGADRENIAVGSGKDSRRAVDRDAAKSTSHAIDSANSDAVILDAAKSKTEAVDTKASKSDAAKSDAAKSDTAKSSDATKSDTAGGGDVVGDIGLDDVDGPIVRNTQGAEMNQSAGQVRIVGRDKEKEMLARLAWLLLDAGTMALRATFDSIHPPLSLRDHLKQTHVKTVLQRLLQQAVLNDKQWELLYPTHKKHTSSNQYDSRTLIILLETICHLCPPYPNGWATQPLKKDGSLSADVVRLQLLFQDIARLDAIAGDAYVPWFIQIRDVITRLGGPRIRLKISRIESELINLDLQQHYIKTLREGWHPGSMQKLERVHELRMRTSRSRKSYTNAKGNEEGLSPEDKVTLKKTYKLIVETVLAEDVVDRLQQSQVVKFSDRQEVLAIPKKQERMQVLLDKIADSKLPYALKALFDAMKFKYKKLYDHAMAVRKQTYKEGVVTTVDVAGITEEALVNHYKASFSRIHPFPWSETVHGTIREIYTPLDIVDSDGQKLSSRELLPAASNANSKGQRVVLEGESGSGKSVLCSWLAYTWATQPNYFRNQFQHLIYLNMSSLSGNFETAVYKSLFTENFKISINEFWKMLDNKASGVLLLIDDYDSSLDLDITDILTGTRLKESTVLLAMKPNSIAPSIFVPDTKWFNFGLNELNIKRCFKTCVALCDLDPEQFEKLYHLAGKDTWQLRQYLANPMLAIMAFAVFHVLRKGTMLRDMKTTCDLLEKYGVAMATLYCRKQKIDIIGFEFPDEVLRAIEALDMFAFQRLMSGQKNFSPEDVISETNAPIVLKFGAFNGGMQGSMLKFACGISMDFLAARHIADMSYEEMENTIMKNKMVKLPKYKQLMSYVCGQYRDDTDTHVLQSLFDQLAARNEYCIRGFYMPATPAQSPVHSEATRGKVPRGVLDDFATSLQCLSECTERDDVIQTIAQSLPERLIMKVDGPVALKTMHGLCLALKHRDCAVRELELELHQYHYPQLDHFLHLAAATSACSNIKSLKITWSSLDVMACYLATVMEHSKSIENVLLTEDPNSKPVKHVSAATWAALQSACSNMNSVQQFSFLNGRGTAIVNHVLQYMSTNITHVNVTGCAFNLMCAGQVAYYLHGNTTIRSLDLSSTKLNSSEFVAIFQGMQMCEGIGQVRVRGIRLDRPCIIALVEYIKLTHSLEVLDLSDCELNTEMCTRLVSAIRQNRTLSRLIFNNAKITSEGRRVISKSKTKLKPVSVEGLVKIC